MYVERDRAKEFWDSTSKLKDIWHKSMKEKEFNMGEFMIIKTIYFLTHNSEDSLGVKPSDIGKNLFIKKPTISKILNNLEDKGYINRISNKVDRRIVYVNLTEKGIRLFEEHKIKMSTYMNKIVSKMGNEDMDILITLVNKLSNSLEEVLEEEQKNLEENIIKK